MTNAPKLLLSNLPKLYEIEIASLKRSIQVRWIDFAVGSLETDYPSVEQFLFKPIRSNAVEVSGRDSDPVEIAALSGLAWEAVEAVNWSTGMIQVKDLDAIQAVNEEPFANAVLLVRDILDAYVIDLQNRRLTRANDLVLDECEGLRLKAADTGLRALLRRLSGGRYQGYREYELQDWKYVEFLRGEPSAVWSGARYHRRIEHLPQGEIASLVEGLPYLHAAELISLLPHQLAADTLELLSSERQLQVFEELEEADALLILEKMAPDIAADLIARLAHEQARHYLDRLPKPSQDRVVDLLRYPENTVGGIMTNDVIAIPGALTIAEARERLRTRLQAPDFVYFLYVVENDENMLLKGVVTLRSILVARDDQRLEEIMNTYLETLDPLDSPREAAYRLIKSQLAALPVSAADGRLLGVVTVDAAVNLVAPNAWSNQAPRIFS